MITNLRKAALILLPALMISTIRAVAQGCSDAGFCTAGAMQSGQAHDSAAMKISIGLSLSSGAGENGTSIVTPQLEATVAIGKQGEAGIKIPFNSAWGNLGSHSGIGDVLLTYTRQLRQRSRAWAIQYTIGSRVSIGNAAVDNEYGAPLPMPYQSNLGTTDLIAGIGAAYGRYIDLSAGYQQPLLQYNDNGYLPTVIYPAPPGDYDYFASAKLRRRGDVLLRAEGRYQWRKAGVSAGPLLIYHLGRDGITLGNGEKISLKGSEGLTLNLAGSVYCILGKYKLSFTGGTPLAVREYRPDGLTRSWVTTLKLTRGF